jgi:UDP-2,4-diacetamido-2,4,6-trideoxy-beta-L-altropyranose hydrolase
MRLLIRADASARMGTGHVMRCLALGQAWQDAGGAVEFLTRCESGVLLDRLVSEGMGVTPLAEDADWPALERAVQSQRAIQSQSPTALVLDGYHFDAEYQRRARDLCRPLLVIDDNAHLTCYCADLVLNQNVHAGQLSYTVGPDTRLLLGCRWALLRREFRRWQDWRRQVPPLAEKLLVTLGGSDPENVTLRVIEALQCSALRDKLQVVVVAGGGNPHLPSLERAAGESPALELRSNVDDMPSLMAWADAAITAAGSTCWEAAFLGLPSLTVIVADNQERGARGLEQSGATVNLGWHRDLTARRIASVLDDLLPAQSRRQRMSESGSALVDGNGAPATVAVVRSLLRN